MPPHKSRSASISFVEGQQNGAGDSPPLRFLLRGRLRRFILPVYLLSLRGFVSSRRAFYLSRQRHGAGMNQVRLHRHATAAMCGSCATTKNHAGQNPGTGFFIATHHPESQAWSLRVLFIVPRPPSLSGCAGSRCAAPSAHLPRLPSAPSDSLNAPWGLLPVTGSTGLQ